MEVTGKRVVVKMDMGTLFKKKDSGKLIKYYPGLKQFTVAFTDNVETTFRCTESFFLKYFDIKSSSVKKKKDDILDDDVMSDDNTY